MNGSKISILGLYRYEPSIFEGLQLPEAVDKDTLINTILLECSDLELIYADVMTMTLAITAWSNKSQITWQKLLETTTAEYSPIENYDRYEDTTDRTHGSSTSTGQVAGFNSSDFENRDHAESVGDTTATHTAHIHGNIGVTTAMRMIKEQRDVVKFNIYDAITEDFKQRFCLLVY